MVPDTVTQKSLICYTHGTEQYEAFCNECFITKSKKLSDTNQTCQTLKIRLKPTLNRKTIQ